LNVKFSIKFGSYKFTKGRLEQGTISRSMIRNYYP